MTVRRHHLLLAGLAATMVGATACGSESTDPADGAAETATDVELGEKPDVDVGDAADASELRIDDLVVGEGDEATAGDAVTVHYVGVSAANCDEFDASWDRGEPLQFQLGGGMVIEGWELGVEGMQVGGRRQLTIPPQLAYGERGVPGAIGPNETLVFVVDLLEVG